MATAEKCFAHEAQMKALEQRLTKLEKTQSGVLQDLSEMSTNIKTLCEQNKNMTNHLSRILNLIENGKGAWWMLTKLAVVISTLVGAAAGAYHLFFK